MTIVDMNFRVAVPFQSQCAETPIWDARIEKLYWIDLFPGDVHRYDPLTGADEVFASHDGPIGSAVPTSDTGKMLVAGASGIRVLDLATGQSELWAHPEPGRPENRYNDTRVDARGRVFTSTVSKAYGTEAFTPNMRGNFYMVDTDGSVRTIVAGILQYNATVWNVDDTKMYVVDTGREKLLEFDYDIETGPLGAPRDVIDFAGFGMPDGVSVDEDGRFYVCHWDSKLTIWSSDFKLLETVALDVPYAACGGFGGRDMRDFYLATAAFAFTEEEYEKYPDAGGILVSRCEAAGTADHFFPLR